MDKFLMNRLANADNEFQGGFKRVLCVCSAGLLRSPTAAFVLSQEPYNFNTRAAGLTKEFALVPIDRVLLHWADEIVCMGPDQERELLSLLRDIKEDTPVYNLNIDDCYEYRNPELIEAIKTAYNQRTTNA